MSFNLEKGPERNKGKWERVEEIAYLANIWVYLWILTTSGLPHTVFRCLIFLAGIELSTSIQVCSAVWILGSWPHSLV